MDRARLRDGALHLLLAGVVTAPLLAWPLGRLAGSPNVDVWNHAWGPWWWLFSLQQGRLPWETGLLQAPVGGVLWFIDPILAALGAPLAPTTRSSSPRWPSRAGRAGGWRAAWAPDRRRAGWGPLASRRAPG